MGFAGDHGWGGGDSEEEREGCGEEVEEVARDEISGEGAMNGILGTGEAA